MKKKSQYQLQLEAIQEAYKHPKKGMTTAQSVEQAYNENLPKLVKTINQKTDRMRKWFKNKGLNPIVSQSSLIREGTHLKFSKKMTMDEKRQLFQRVNTVLTDTKSYNVKSYVEQLNESIDRIGKFTDVSMIKEIPIDYRIAYMSDFWSIINQLRNSDETIKAWHDLYEQVQEQSPQGSQNIMAGLFQFYTDGTWDPFDKLNEFKQRLAELSGKESYFKDIEEDEFEWF